MRCGGRPRLCGTAGLDTPCSLCWRHIYEGGTTHVTSRRLVVAALALSALYPAVVLAQGPCLDGEAMLAAGLLNEAQTWLAGAETNDPCQGDLAQAVAEQRGDAVTLLERAAQALTDEDVVLGRELLAQALTLDQSMTEAREALAASLNEERSPTPTPTPSPTPKPYAGAEALAGAGFPNEARAALLEDAKKHGEPVPSRLRYLTDTPWPLNVFQPIMPAGALPLIAWLIPFVLALIAISVVIALRVMQPPRFLVEDLTGSSEAEDVGRQIASMIQEALQQAKREGGGGSLSILTQPDPKIDLPAEVEGLPYGKFIAPLLNLAVPPKIMKLQGQLHVLDGQLLGATSNLVSPNNAVRDTTSVWLNDFATPLLPLAAKDAASASPDEVQMGVRTISAALTAWARFALPDTTGAAAGQDKARVIPTGDWKSLAFMQVGALHQLAGKKHRLNARRLFVKSLDYDPMNSGALFNLAMLDMSDKRWTVGKERFEEALHRIESQNQEAGIKDSMDRLWYRCAYNLGAAQFHEWIALGADKANRARLTSAGEMGRIVIRNALEARALTHDQSLKSFLTMAGQSALVMLAGTKAYVEAAAPGTDQHLTEEYLKDAVADNSQVSLSAGQIIKFIKGPEAKKHGLSYRVRYNLACYFSTTGDLDDAVKELDLGLERGDMVAWAPNDPTLEALKKRRKKEWNDVIARHSDPVPELSPPPPWWKFWKWQVWE